MANSVWNVTEGSVKIDPNEKLFLFGYSCKIFPNDEKSDYVEKGKHLIPWMGDKTLMIDRYDVRGYLHDLKQYEPSGREDFSSEEEKLIDEERYRSLRSDMTEEQLYQEEELKRLRAAIAGDGAYHEIAFSYDNPEVEEQAEPVATKFEDPEDDLYKAPEGLKIPKGTEVPYNMKIHTIIEKTANFVSEQGGQMEIIIKMKQHANPQFGFMHLDNPLHPYYKHLVKEIKSGAYKPVQTRKVSQSEDDDDDDGHYLHPSLMSGKAKDVPEFTVPTINFRRSQDDSYALLVKNLKQHFVEDKLAIPTQQEDVAETSDDGVPPPNMQPVIDKMAEYVAKNGEDFEIIVKSKKDKRFDFLLPGNKYYDYYVQKRDCAKVRMFGSIEESTSEDAPPPTVAASAPAPAPKEEPPSETNSSDSLDSVNSTSDVKTSKIIKGPISFSLKVKDTEASPDVSKMTPLLMDDDSEEEVEGGVPQESNHKIPETPKIPEPPKIMTEALEAKLAEERIKDKLLATARERMALQRKEKQQQMEEQKRAEQHKKEKQLHLDQQRKEKELQLERKRKAALFLKMLKRKDPDPTPASAQPGDDFWTLPDASAENGILFPIDKIIISTGSSTIPGIKTDWSPDRTAENNQTKASDKESSDSEPEKQHERKRRKKRKRSRSRERRRHKSPPKHYKKEKKLPAAYAVHRSRSRSRSPRRYRSLPNWKRR